MNIEPTYLRYVHDHLKKGFLSADNAANLPHGFTGIFEERFEEDISVKEKQKQLQIFTCFALIKKEVSPQFVASILNKEEQDIIVFIEANSNWFNSSDPSLYALYHDRLRVFILEKQTATFIRQCNKRIIEKIEEFANGSFINEKAIYGLEYLLYHHALMYLFGDKDFNDIEKILNNEKYFQKVIENKINHDIILLGYSTITDCVFEKLDWKILEQISKSVYKYYEMRARQISEDLMSVHADWFQLYGYMESLSDNLAKVRFFFLMFLVERDLESVFFSEICEAINKIAEEEYLNLAEIAPFWLIQKVKNISGANDGILDVFFGEADEDELFAYNQVKPKYWYDEASSIKDYPKQYYKSYLEIISRIEKRTCNESDFQMLFDSVPVNNLFIRDETICRLTQYFLEKKSDSKLFIRWFIWLVTKSNFEVGPHSFGAINTFELCIQFIKNYDLDVVGELLAVFNEINIDNKGMKEFDQEQRLTYFLSEKYFQSNNNEQAKEILIATLTRIKPKDNLDVLVYRWIQYDIDTRIKKRINLENTLYQIEINFTHYLCKNEYSFESFKRSKIYADLGKIDSITRAEYYSQFAIEANKKDQDLSRSLISDAWNLLLKTDDTIEEGFALLSVFSSALEVMDEKWVNNAFKKIKATLLNTDEIAYHLSETLLSKRPGRFNSECLYFVIKEKYPQIFRFLRKEFKHELEFLEKQFQFEKHLSEDLNRYNSIREYWKENKKYFNLGEAGNGFFSFWDYIKEDTNIFNSFTTEDVRIINVINGKVNYRFPWEKFTHNNSKLIKYKERYSIHDIFLVGYNEGFECWNWIRESAEWNDEFVNLIYGALDGNSKRYKSFDWVNEQSIYPIILALKKCLHHESSLYLIMKFICLRNKLVLLS
jgi:hypothetical protein